MRGETGATTAEGISLPFAPPCQRRARTINSVAAEGSSMGEYTVMVEAGTTDGADWQALAPPKTAVGDDAAEVARWTATHQDLLEGQWRVRVWNGAKADISRAPAAEVYSNTM